MCGLKKFGFCSPQSHIEKEREGRKNFQHEFFKYQNSLRQFSYRRSASAIWIWRGNDLQSLRLARADWQGDLDCEVLHQPHAAVSSGVIGAVSCCTSTPPWKKRYVIRQWCNRLCCVSTGTPSVATPPSATHLEGMRTKDQQRQPVIPPFLSKVKSRG